MPKNKRILGAALLLVLGLIFVFFAVSPWEILPFLKGGSFRVQAGITDPAHSFFPAAFSGSCHCGR